MTPTFVALVVAAVVLGTIEGDGAAQVPLPILYYCEGDKFHYNLDNIEKPGYAVAIASKDTTFDKLSPDSSSSAGCYQKFMKFKAKGVTGIANDQTLTCPNLITDKTMYLYMMNSTFERKTIGGKSFETHELPCEIKDNNKIVTVKKGFTDSPTVAPPKTTQLPSMLGMTVGHTPTTIPGTSFTVGEELTVTIQVDHSTTKENYYLRIEECKAASTEDGSNTFKIIYKEKIVETEVIPLDESANLASKGPVAATGNPITFHMYAFKFYDTDNVILTCSVKVCTGSACPQPTRKRRSVNEESVGVASTSFTVHRKHESSSGQTFRVPSLTAVITVLALLYAVVL